MFPDAAQDRCKRLRLADLVANRKAEIAEVLALLYIVADNGNAALVELMLKRGVSQSSIAL